MAKINYQFGVDEQTDQILRIWKEQGCNVSAKIRKGIDLVREEEKLGTQKKLDTYVKEDTLALQALPPVWDHLTRDDLIPLEPKELYNLFLATQHNANLVAAFTGRRAYGVHHEILQDNQIKNWLASHRIHVDDHIPLKS